MFCENCGAPLEDGVKFCPNCGTKVMGEAPASAPAAARPQQTGKLYYPDPKRYTTYTSFKAMMEMYSADDIDDFPND